MNKEGEISEPNEAAQDLVRVTGDNAKPVDPCDPKNELMPLSSESATASGSDPSICHSAVARESKVETRATLCLPSSNPKEYIVKFEGNNSKKWDGREINLDGEWLESLYDPKELTSGKQLRLPWPEKGEEKYWNAVLMEPKQEISSCDITYSNTPSSSKGKTTRKRKAPSKTPNVKKQCAPHAKKQKKCKH